MTQKELLYLEDAIGHEKTIIKVVETSIEQIEDENLKTFLEQELTRHEQTKQNLMNLLEVKANE